MANIWWQENEYTQYNKNDGIDIFFHVLVLNKSWDKFLSKTTKTICAMTDYEKLINKKESTYNVGHTTNQRSD